LLRATVATSSQPGTIAMIASIQVSPHQVAAQKSNSPESQWKEKLRDGTTVLIRPIRGEDAEIERRFIEQLSPAARRLRFLGEIKTPTVDRQSVRNRS